MNQTEQIIAILNHHGQSAAPARSIGDHALYINGYGRDIYALIFVDKPDWENLEHLFQRCRLVVSSDAHKPQGWQVDRAKQVKHRILLKFAEIDRTTNGALYGPRGIQVCAHWQDVKLHTKNVNWK